MQQNFQPSQTQPQTSSSSDAKTQSNPSLQPSSSFQGQQQQAQAQFENLPSPAQTQPQNTQSYEQNQNPENQGSSHSPHYGYGKKINKKGYKNRYPKDRYQIPLSELKTDPKSFHKTKMCPNMINGQCQRGDNCTYAHSKEELKSLPDLKKTKPCINYLRGTCTKGIACNYSHGEQNINQNYPELSGYLNNLGKSKSHNHQSNNYKTEICKYYTHGYCRNGQNCIYAHGQHEMKKSNSYQNPYMQFQNPMFMQNPMAMGMIPNQTQFPHSYPFYPQLQMQQMQMQSYPSIPPIQSRPNQLISNQSAPMNVNPYQQHNR